MTSGSAARAGTGALVRLALRRDRLMLPVWIALLTAIAAGTAASFKSLYPDPAALRTFATGVASNPALRALYGPVFDPTSVGGLTAWRLGTTGAMLTAVMSLLMVVRHTRAEEEAGRLELVGAGVVGRHAPLTAALLVALLADLGLALLVAVSLTAAGTPGAGAIAFGVAWAGTGLVFAAVAAVSAQLTESARAANGIAIAVLGFTYLLRAAGDTAGEAGPRWLSWLSPIGWAAELRPFAGERWWVAGLAAAFAAAATGTAYALVARRDLGAGLVPPRPGPPEASPVLRSPLTLAWRLQRGALLGWAVGFAVAGAAMGSVAKGVTSLVQGSPALVKVLDQLGGQSRVVDAFLATAMALLGLVASGYAVQASLRLRGEETGQRADPVLATSVRRTHWVASHLVIAASGTALLLTVAGLVAGLAYGAQAGDLGRQVGRVLSSALVQLPAAWVLAGVTLALFGLAPRLATAGWAVLAACLVLGQLGPVLGLSQWAMDLSPFTHVPKLPGAELSVAPLAWLVAVAAVLATAGVAGFRQRDVG